MGKKLLYIIRHGETDQNKMNIVQGSGVDSCLNANGQAQAQAFYEHYKDTPFQKVYVSALQRTHQSVKPFLDAGLPHEQLPGLNEISWGIYEGIPHSKEFFNQYQQRVEDWREGRLHLPIDGGESPQDLNERQKPAVEHILSKQEEETILVCTHGRALKALLCLLLDIPLTQMDTFEHQNLGLYLFEFADGKFNLLKRNDHEHLNRVGYVNDMT
ncbi:MAG: histidine phosphatase family protein [Flavobacteriaceae bacterium]|nr:histidine phosphatase family protein [Flavobacteriaceae bacterium]